MAEPQVLFVQRDGALLADAEAPQRAEDVNLAPGVVPALARLARAGWQLVLIGDPERSAPPASVADWLESMLASQGVAFTESRHGPVANGEPAVALLRTWTAGAPLDRARSLAVGDTRFAALVDCLGVTTRTPATGGWPALAHELLDRPRVGEVVRRTSETMIRVRVDLDAEGPQRIATGLGFFDHMLEQIGRHGGFALDLECEGDLHIDEHHTVEDCALALGGAIDRALGDRRGIGRFGFLLPMDDTRAQVAVDLGGRPYCVFEADFPRDAVGGLSTEMVAHFFRSLAEALRANIHVSVAGSNTHHMVEACFKGTGRALRDALARRGESLPSTKGLL